MNFIEEELSILVNKQDAFSKGIFELVVTVSQQVEAFDAVIDETRTNIKSRLQELAEVLDDEHPPITYRQVRESFPAKPIETIPWHHRLGYGGDSSGSD
jgi:hypothetical protein